MDYNPICIYPEMTTTNNTSLLKFKKGAFASMRTVIPAFAKVGDSYLKPVYDTPHFLPFMFMYFASFGVHHLHLTIMPEFSPTEWMLNNHKDKGSQDWEIYAECVRDAMSRQGNFRKDDRQIRDKLKYEELMKGEKQEIEVDGKIFRYP